MKKDQLRKMDKLQKEIENMQMELNQKNMETEIVTNEFEKRIKVQDKIFKK